MKPRGHRSAHLRAALWLALAIVVRPARADDGETLNAGDAALPRSAHMESLLIPDGETGSANSDLDVTAAGLPVVADGARLFALGSGKSVVDIAPFRIDDFAFMRGDGRLLLISGDRLISPGPDGPVQGPILPSSGMKVRPAGETTAFLFGGIVEPASHDLYMVRSDGMLAKLATMPSPIVDVSGFAGDDDGAASIDVFIATGRNVFRIVGRRPVKKVFEADADIFSIAATPNGAVFYATRNGVGYVDDDGPAVEFMRGHTGVVRTGGKSLYVWSPEERRLFRLGDIADLVAHSGVLRP
jgi:hypothetical protein